jgi:hypothetical protein
MLKPLYEFSARFLDFINSTLGRRAVIRFWLIPSRMKTLLPFKSMAKISEQFRNNKGRTAGETR